MAGTNDIYGMVAADLPFLADGSHQVVPNDGANHYFVTEVMTGGWSYAWVEADMGVIDDYGDPDLGVICSIQLSHDGVDWIDTTIRDLLEVPPDPLTSLPDAVTASDTIQTQAVALNHSMHAAAIGIVNQAYWVRLVVNSPHAIVSFMPRLCTTTQG